MSGDSIVYPSLLKCMVGLAMKSPTDLPWWAPLPGPVLWGVTVSWIPLSVPMMMGLAFGAGAYLLLNKLLDQTQVSEPT
jgi:hypothetical protein